MADIVSQDVPQGASQDVSPLRAFWDAFKENRGAVAGLFVVLLIVLIAILADVIAPYGPNEQFRDAVRVAPMWIDGGSGRFILGTDGLGRDMLSRLIHGARISLFIGAAVMGVSFIIGVLLGLACVSLGNMVDVVVTRLMDLIMAVPSLVLAILVVAVLGPSLTNTIVAVTIVYLPRYVRLVRASALRFASATAGSGSRSVPLACERCPTTWVRGCGCWWSA